MFILKRHIDVMSPIYRNVLKHCIFPYSYPVIIAQARLKWMGGTLCHPQVQHCPETSDSYIRILQYYRPIIDSANVSKINILLSVHRKNGELCVMQRFNKYFIKQYIFLQLFQPSICPFKDSFYDCVFKTYNVAA